MCKFGVLSSTLVSTAFATAMISSALAADFDPSPVHVQELDFAIQAEITGGGTWLDEGGAATIDDEDYPFLSGAARASIPFNPNWSAQLDIDGLATFTSRSNGDDNLQDYFFGSGHLTWRDPTSFAFGAFGSVGSSSGGEDENATFWLIGAEGQFYLPTVTLYGQAGYFEADDENENDVITDAWFARAVVRWFIGPDMRLQGEGSYTNGDENDSPAGDFEMWSWEVRYDQRFTGTPVGWFIGYNGMWGELDPAAAATPNESFTEHSFWAGLSFTFGYNSKMTLLDNDRYGATLDTPEIGRWTGYTTEVIDD